MKPTIKTSNFINIHINNSLIIKLKEYINKKYIHYIYIRYTKYDITPKSKYNNNIK